MNVWLQTCDDARQAMRRVAKMMLDQQSHELFEICNAMSGMGAEADDQDSGAVACGLYAVCYRVAGSEKVIANAVMQTLTSVDKLAVSGLGIKKKMINHQSAIKEFAMALQEDCCNELMHLTSEIDVILEHPFCAVDDSFHGRLQSLHDSLEGHMEQIYEVGGQLLEHPIMKINASAIGRLKILKTNKN